MLNDNGVFVIVIALSFLTKIPDEYFCTHIGDDGITSCKPTDFCNDPTVKSFEPNMDLPDSYNNWVQRFDLHCASGGKIGLIGSSLFIGWVTTLLIVPRISDRYGRVMLMRIGNLVSFLAYTGILLTTRYEMLIACIFTLGAMATIRVQISTLYFYELVTRKVYPRVSTVFATCGTMPGILIALYFKYMSKEAMTLLHISYSMLVVGTIALFFYPEAPRFLIKSHRIDQAITVLQSIAAANDVDSVKVSKGHIKEKLGMR